MAVLSDVSSVEYTGDGSQVEFPVPFSFAQDSDLVVKLELSGQAPVTQVLNVAYSVTGAGESSGAIEMLVAPPTASTLTIERTVALTQAVQFRLQGSFSPVTHESALDKQLHISQQLERRIADLESAVGTPGDITLAGYNELLATISGIDAELNAKFAAMKFNVMDYGAHANFPTDDDTAHIQAAIDAAEAWVLASGGGAAKATVYIPAGHYRVNGQLNVGSDNIGIEGDGPGASVLEVSGNLYPAHPMLKVQRNGSLLHTNDTYTHIHRFEKFGLASDQYGSTSALLELVGPSSTELVDLSLIGGATALKLQYCLHTVVRRCNIAAGLYTANIWMVDSDMALVPTTTTTFEHCYIHAGKIGYRGGGTVGVTFNDCIFESHTVAGITLGENGDLNDLVRLNSCHFENNYTNIVAGTSADLDGQGNLRYSIIEMKGGLILGGPLTDTHAAENYVFDLGNCSMVLDSTTIIVPKSSDYTFRVNRGGRATRRVTLLGFFYNARDDFGPGTAYQVSFAKNDGTDSPFVGHLGSAVDKLGSLSGTTLVPDFVLGGGVLLATLTGATSVSEPAGGTSMPPLPGQRLTFVFTQDGTGGRTVTWDAVYKHSWSDVGNTLGKKSSISFVFDGTNWVQTSYAEWL